MVNHIIMVLPCPRALMVGCCEVDCTWKYAGASPRKKTRNPSRAEESHGRSDVRIGRPWRRAARLSRPQHPSEGNVTKVVTKRRGGFAQAPSMKQGPQDPREPGRHHTLLHADQSTEHRAHGRASASGSHPGSTARQVPVGWDAHQGPLCPLCPSAAVLHVVNPRAGEASAGASKRLKPPLTQTGFVLNSGMVDV